MFDISILNELMRDPVNTAQRRPMEAAILAYLLYYLYSKY